MDELTIGEKTYISSKRAAKITGYAKDYVGQLCREGRVEARLVGRNWYVLESSILEHRFGAEVAEPKEAVEEAAVADKTPSISWEAPKYEVEVPVMVPELSVRKPEVVSRQVVSEMQDAWQEWFSTQKTAQKKLSDGSHDFDGHELPAIIVEAPTVTLAEVEEHVASIPDAFQPEEVVVMHRSYQSHAEEVQALVPEIPVLDLGGRREVVAAAHERVAYPKKAGSNLVLKSLLVGLAFLAACVALIGTGVMGDALESRDLVGGPYAEFVKYLGGVTEYKSMK